MSDPSSSSSSLPPEDESSTLRLALTEQQQQQNEEEPKEMDKSRSIPSPPTTVGWATILRQHTTPYLPPPVVSAMKYSIDPTLEPWIGPEGTVTLVTTLALALLVVKLLSLVLGWSSSSSLSSSSSSTNKWGAIQEDEQQSDTLIPSLPVGTHYDGTVVFCGPPTGGKTSLLYALVYPNHQASSRITTVSSIQPNTGLVQALPSSSSTTISSSSSWRCIDIPGHWSPSKVVTTVTGTISNPTTVVVVVVLDATQPVAKAVDYLYAWLMTLPSVTSTTAFTSHHKGPKKLLVVGHKSDSPKAKNIRRLKLQIKQELERLHTLATTTTTTPTTTLPLVQNWDQVLNEHVEFVSTSVLSPLSMEALQSYLATS